MKLLVVHKMPWIQIKNTFLQSLHVVVLQSKAKKCTKTYKSYNARAQPWFYSLNLLFSGVLVAVAVVGFRIFRWII